MPSNTESPAPEQNGLSKIAPELDVSKLHSLPTEQQDFFLLNLVHDLEEYVKTLSSEYLPAQQAFTKKEIIKIVGLSSPAPSRVVRQTAGRILADIFSRGSTQLLLETVNDLLSIINSSKNEKDLSNKHAAAVCLGLLYKDAGTSAVGVSALAISSLIKLLKNSTNHIGIRASTVRALGQITTGLSSSIDEQAARDIWRQSRSLASTDKSYFVQRCACTTIRALVQYTPYFLNSHDHESLKSTIWKVLDSNSVHVRVTAAKALADQLVRAYSETGSGESIPVVRKPRKTRKGELAPNEEDDEDVPTTPIPTKAATQLSLNFSEILQILSNHYCKAATSNRARAGLAVCYKAVLETLPEKVVQEQYPTLADHLFNDLIDFPTIANNRYRLLLTREFVNILLSNVVLTNVLPENGQITACRWLINDVLKNYPKVITERREPSKRVLTVALRALSSLVARLGSASTSFQDSCRDALFQVLQHPSYTVQVHAARCFRVFIEACPQQLSRSIDLALSNIKKDLDPSAETRNHRRALGGSMSVAAMLSTARHSPLFGSIELFSGCLSFATDLLKSSASSELRLCATQVQIAWTIIGGLMTLGPGFVKVQLNQLLLMWKNASPPPLTQDNSAKRGQLELSFLTHVRECAFTALLTFLNHNSTLITLDGSKRISTTLHNAVSFLGSLPNNKQTEDLSSRLIPALQLQDYTNMLRRRVLQCMIKLLGLKHVNQNELASQSDVISLTISTMVNPERPTHRNLEASLASSVSTFEGLWELSDNWAYGMNSLFSDYEISLPSSGSSRKIESPYTMMDEVEYRLGNASSRPVPPALEHDPVFACNRDFENEAIEFSPPATAAVTASIQLFAIALPLQPARVQDSCLEQLATALSQPMLREPGKKCAIQLNVSVALVSALAVANGETPFSRGKLATQSISRVVAEILRGLLIDADPILRHMAAQAFGRLCNLAGTQFTSGEIKYLIDTIVANRDPNARAGCALALGQVHSQVGAMAASLHLKTIIGVLLSLCSDSHPTVHFWALNGLAAIAESAGLAFSGYASSTLGMLAQLYSNDTHNEESASLASSNADIDIPTPLAIGRCVDSIINVMGPDLQDATKTRQLIFTLLDYFQADDSVPMQVQNFICLGHISMYAPAHVQLTKYVHDLQDALASHEPLLERVAVAGIENIMKRSASEVLRVAKPGLGDELWNKLDKSVSSPALRNILHTWMLQTSLDETSEWISRCQAILSRTRVKKPSKVTAPKTAIKSALPDLADEEAAGLSAAAAVAPAELPDATIEGQEFLRWQTREFAMQLLSEMLSIVQRETTADHTVASEAVLQKKVADIVRVAFSASTANVVALRLWGLRILDQILKLFGKTPDPDFLEASLLEQYQAQISSALTPAFAADSTPDVAAAAIEVCATFVATGIVTNVDRMGRIFKVLSGGLENLTQPEPANTVGDLKALTTNAQSMLTMALLSGWAQLQLASVEQPYIEEILQPYVPKLAPLWLKSLQEFASLRFEPEISNSLGGEYPSGNLQEKYGAFDREVRLKFYQAGWLGLVDAIAVLVEKDSDAVFDALDNKNMTANGSVNGTPIDGRDMSFREEPVAFFFILFGLAYEALVTQARESPSQALAILNALKKILTPAVSGNAVYQDAVFTETTDTLDRLALTSSSETQGVLVDIARNLSIDHVIAKAQDRDDKLSDDIDQLFELTRIVILVLTGLIPTLEDPPGTALRGLTEASTSLVESCFQALVDVSEVFPSIIRGDLHACIIHCYCTMLATGICQHEVITRIMPIFRDFLADVAGPDADDIASRLVRGALLRMLGILGIAQRRENEYSIICAKNTLLSMTVLLSTCGRIIPSNDELCVEALGELLNCLQDVGLAKIAASCLRSLLMVSPKSACDETVARLLWPRLLAFVNDSSADDPEFVRPMLLQALSASTVTLKVEGRHAAMSILIPSLIYRSQQSPPQESKEDPKKESAARLLELVAADGGAFRAVLGALNESDRTLLESLLRSAGTGGKQNSRAVSDEEAKPAIQLRMDF